MGVPRPVPLVYHANGRFRLGREAVSILQRVNGPIAVVSVCGPFKSGKSYISNQLLGRTSGFQMSSTHDRCTKGLWMWSSPLKKITVDGTEYNILAIDTEEIDCSIQEAKYLYLAVVLSSMLVYNEMEYDSSFGSLSLLTKMTDMTLGFTTASELSHLSPMFVWVIRDFTEVLMEMSPSEFMESALKPVDGRQDSIFLNESNEARRSAKAIFADRHCFTLVRPMGEEKELRILDKIAMDRLRPEFKKGMDELRSFVFEKTKPKKIGATVMTGPILVQIIRCILDAFNNGKRPMIACIWENAVKPKPRKALKSPTTASVVGDPPAANTRQRKRSMEQRMSSQEQASIPT